MIFIILSLLGLALAGYFFVGKATPAKEINWGVNFSQTYAQSLDLDWKKAYSALLDDLKVRDIKLITQWDLIELKENEYDFADLDWQINEAEKRNAKILLVIGIKTGRWPECHEPSWLKIRNPKSEIRKSYLLDYIKDIVNRYKDSKAIWAWQVENEPFFSFGECPWKDKDFLKEEVNLVKSLDLKKRPVVISDSGEFSFWITAARIGDMVGVTMYRKTWFKELKRYISYPFSPVFYQRKAFYIDKIFGKKVFVSELQAEPWGQVLVPDLPLAEQQKTMDLERFRGVVSFAGKTGFDRFYFWGAEWWYWLKEKQNKPEIWDAAKKLF
ncbi:MAG: endo-1,4-beta-xylanase [bacterium]